MSGRQGGSCPWLPFGRLVSSGSIWYWWCLLTQPQEVAAGLGVAQGPLVAWCVCDGEGGSVCSIFKLSDL